MPRNSGPLGRKDYKEGFEDGYEETAEPQVGVAASREYRLGYAHGTSKALTGLARAHKPDLAWIERGAPADSEMGSAHRAMLAEQIAWSRARTERILADTLRALENL